MKCPSCGAFSPDDWEMMRPRTPAKFRAPQPDAEAVLVDWMTCANPDCRELVIRIQESRIVMAPGAEGSLQKTALWIVRPRSATRIVDPIIPDPFRSDFQEAAAILPISPRMSAVLSRKILQDVLAKYANLGGFSLAAQIDTFKVDTSYPSTLRENLHHFREVADFGAHTQTNDQAEIIPVEHAEAAWTLDMLERLFDYFIVAPEKDRKIRSAMDQKIKDAGRKPL